VPFPISYLHVYVARIPSFAKIGTHFHLISGSTPCLLHIDPTLPLTGTRQRRHSPELSDDTLSNSSTSPNPTKTTGSGNHRHRPTNLESHFSQPFHRNLNNVLFFLLRSPPHHSSPRHNNNSNPPDQTQPRRRPPLRPTQLGRQLLVRHRAAEYLHGVEQLVSLASPQTRRDPTLMLICTANQRFYLSVRMRGQSVF
jgi:hypothetical protein